MWPAKLPGEGARLYDAVEAMRDAMIAFWIACDGGKDSLSMAAMLGDELVKAPGQLVILGYAKMPDIRKVLTPDIKAPGESYLGLIDLGLGKNRLGGSALLQALNQLGDESPDCDLKLLVQLGEQFRFFTIAAQFFRFTTEAMAASRQPLSKCALVEVAEQILFGSRNIADLFAEELGIVLEFRAGEQDSDQPRSCKKNAPPQ